MTQCVLMTAAGFLSGSVLYSYIIPKLFCHVDIRKESADGNPGCANAITTAGVPVGIICLLLDLCKAFVPVYIAVAFLHISGYFLTPVAVAPVLGHAFSPFAKFHGGKAVAASFGAMLGILPVSKAVFVFAAVVICFKFIIAIKPDSAAMMTASFVAGVLLAFLEPLAAIKLSSAAICLVLCGKHFFNQNAGEVYAALFGVWKIKREAHRLKFTKI